MSLDWYGVRCIFEHRNAESSVDGGTVYEERVVILRADSFEDAIERAEREAASYCRALDDVHYVDSAQAYILADDPWEKDAENGAEVFSLMRSSALSPEAYVDQFFDTGAEHGQPLQNE